MLRIDTKATGKKIYDKIMESDYSPQTIAIQLNVSTSTPYYWFEGKVFPKLATLVNLAHILDCTVDDLLVTETDESNE